MGRFRREHDDNDKKKDSTPSSRSRDPGDSGGGRRSQPVGRDRPKDEEKDSGGGRQFPFGRGSDKGDKPAGRPGSSSRGFPVGGRDDKDKDTGWRSPFGSRDREDRPGDRPASSSRGVPASGRDDKDQDSGWRSSFGSRDRENRPDNRPGSSSRGLPVGGRDDKDKDSGWRSPFGSRSGDKKEGPEDRPARPTGLGRASSPTSSRDARDRDKDEDKGGGFGRFLPGKKGSKDKEERGSRPGSTPRRSPFVGSGLDDEDSSRDERDTYRRPSTGMYGDRPSSPRSPIGTGDRDQPGSTRPGTYGDRPGSPRSPIGTGDRDQPGSTRPGLYGDRSGSPRSPIGTGDRDQPGSTRPGLYGDRSSSPRSPIGAGDRDQPGSTRPGTYGDRPGSPRSPIGTGDRDQPGSTRPGLYGDRPGSPRSPTGAGDRNQPGSFARGSTGTTDRFGSPTTRPADRVGSRPPGAPIRPGTTREPEKKEEKRSSRLPFLGGRDKDKEADVKSTRSSATLGRTAGTLGTGTTARRSTGTYGAAPGSRDALGRPATDIGRQVPGRPASKSKSAARPKKASAVPASRAKSQAKPLAETKKAPRLVKGGWDFDRTLDMVGVGLVVIGGIILVAVLPSMSVGVLPPTQGGVTGFVNHLLSQLFGWGKIIWPLACFAIGIWLMLRYFGGQMFDVPYFRVVGALILYACLLTWLQMLELVNDPAPTVEAFRPISKNVAIQQGQGGGWFGHILYIALLSQLGDWGTLVSLIGWLILGLMLTFDVSVVEIGKFVAAAFVFARPGGRKSRAEKRAAQQAATAQSVTPTRPGEEAPAKPRQAPLTSKAAARSAAKASPPAVAPAPAAQAQTGTPAPETDSTSPRPQPLIRRRSEEESPAATASATGAPAGAPAADVTQTEQQTRELSRRRLPHLGSTQETEEVKADQTPAVGQADEAPAPDSEEKKPGGRFGRLRGSGSKADETPAAAEQKPEGTPASASAARAPSTPPASGLPVPPRASSSPRSEAARDVPAVTPEEVPPGEAPRSPFRRPSDLPKRDMPPAEDSKLEETSPDEAPRSPFRRPSDLPKRDMSPAEDSKPEEPSPDEAPRSPFRRPGSLPKRDMSPAEDSKPEEPSPDEAPRSPFRRTGDLPGREAPGRVKEADAEPFAKPAGLDSLSTDEPERPRPSDRFRPPAGHAVTPDRAEGKPGLGAAPAGTKEEVATETLPVRDRRPFGPSPLRRTQTLAGSPDEEEMGEIAAIDESDADQAKPSADQTGVMKGDGKEQPEPDTPMAKPALTPPARPSPFRAALSAIGVARSGSQPEISASEQPAQAAQKPDVTIPPVESNPEAQPESKPAAVLEKAPEVSEQPVTSQPSPSPERPVMPVRPAPAPRTAVPDTSAPVRPAATSRAEESRPGRPPVGAPVGRPAASVAQGENAPQARAVPPAPGIGRFELPDFRKLLRRGSEQHVNDEILLDKARIIEDTLESFGAPGKVVEVNPGPVITQFGVEPDYLVSKSGKKTRIKVGAIARLDADLALALAAKSIRIEAPVPGKGFVGIEVPNDEVALVSLYDIMDSSHFQQIDSKLRLALGLSVDGTPVSADLTAMPHLLIAGTTGSGKSVCVNSIISCLLLSNTPDDVQFIMIDPKRVELTSYNGIPHLVAPVVVDLERIVGVLQWVQREMEERYRKFASTAARNILDYNMKIGPSEKKMPYYVVVVDELADLMMLAPDETERLLARLAQMARATGIHLVISTQRPSVDIITGLIKANFPARIAFAVASSVDSRVILDQPGAEKLLGRGDMLFQSPDAAAPLRMQGVFVSDEEINRITRYWKGLLPEDSDSESGRATTVLPKRDAAFTPTPAVKGPPPAPVRPDAGQRAFWDDADASIDGDDDGGEGGEDELYDEAVELVKRLNKASVSLLQRRLRIGYTRAARLIDMMEQEGIVGSAESGSKPREVLGQDKSDSE